MARYSERDRSLIDETVEQWAKKCLVGDASLLFPDLTEVWTAGAVDDASLGGPAGSPALRGASLLPCCEATRELTPSRQRSCLPRRGSEGEAEVVDGLLLEELRGEPEMAMVDPAVVVESGPGSKKSSALNCLLALICHAEDHLDLFTPYFVPDRALIHALQVCAARGVSVRLMVSAKSDRPLLVDVGRSFYPDLLSAGVRIFEHGRSMQHMKLAAADRKWLMAGSVNLDVRSFHLNFEAGVLLRSEPLGDRMHRTFDRMLNRCEEIHLDRFSDRPIARRIKEGFLRLWTPLL